MTDAAKESIAYFLLFLVGALGGLYFGIQIGLSWKQ